MNRRSAIISPATKMVRPTMVRRTDTTNSDGRGWGGGVRVRECERVRACVHVCVHACVRDVFAIYDNNILPRPIMVIIKIIILYFIQIRHTGDFPSTGTRLVCINT